MAKVYGTNGHDFLGVFRGFFDRDGVTDGDDWIFGFGGDDWIEGHDGNDFLFGGEGADLLDGGDDIDTAIYSDSPAGVTVDLQTGKGHGGTAEGDQLYSIENVTGSWWGDHLIGNANDNVLSGLGGNDDLEGGAGADTLDGGWGVDRAIYSDSPAGVMVSLLWGSASGGDAEGDKLISIESLYGSEYDDGLFGDNGANSLQGYLGDDVLLGYGDNDFLEGSDGYDALWGGFGNDLLSGGENGDTLAGGPGADTFVWTSYFGGQYDSGGVLPSGDVDWANMDVVLDFTPGEDKIDVGSVDANAVTFDPTFSYDDFTFIGEPAASLLPDRWLTGVMEPIHISCSTRTGFSLSTLSTAAYRNSSLQSGSPGCTRRMRTGSLNCSALAAPVQSDGLHRNNGVHHAPTLPRASHFTAGASGS